MSPTRWWSMPPGEARRKAKEAEERASWTPVCEPSIDGVVRVRCDGGRRQGFMHVEGGPVFEFIGNHQKHLAYFSAARREPVRKPKPQPERRKRARPHPHKESNETTQK